MALGTNHVIASEVPNFIPELWSDEVIASYKSNLVFAPLVRTLNHRGKKGDTIKVPTPTRGNASDKTAETEVTLIQHGTDAGLSISIDKHKEYSRLIEDIVDVQALESLRRFYTDDGGYAIAKQVDVDIIIEMLKKSGASITTDSNDTNVTTASTFPTLYEGDGTTWDESTTITAVDDGGIRTFVRLLDVNDVPMANRVFVVHPLTKEDLLGIARFTEEAFVGERGRGNTIRNGLVGDLYNMDVYVTNQLPTVEEALGTTAAVLNYVFHQDAAVLVEQAGVRSQTQYKQEYLADLFTVDMIYGTKILRDDSIVPVVTPNS